VSRREDVAFARRQFAVSERRACELLNVDRASCRYRARPERDGELRETMREIALRRPRFGYRRLTIELRKTGVVVNVKRVRRWCRDLGLCVRRHKRKRLVRVPAPWQRIAEANQEWAMDFVSDAMASGRALRILTVLDCGTRESPALEVATSIGSRRVVRVLERVSEERGCYPSRIRVDNGPEFTSRYFLAWCAQRRIQVIHIEPGKPVQNAMIESFNGRLRDECLNVSWFGNLSDARSKIALWREDYNTARPHSALGYRTPAEFAALAKATAQAALTGRPSGTAWASAPASAQQCVILTGESHL